METYLVVQWLGFCTSTAGGICLIPGPGTKIPQAMWHSKKEKKKKGNGCLFSNGSLRRLKKKLVFRKIMLMMQIDMIGKMINNFF